MDGVVIKDRFKIKGRIGHGAFGEIYKGLDLQCLNHEVAVKIESVDAKHPLLRHEYKVYRELTGASGFCKIFYYGTINNAQHNALVMELLGRSLESLFDLCGRSFTIPTVFRIADQLITGLQIMHERHLIHGDVKPENFMCGTGQFTNKLYCVDFGLSKRYRDPVTLVHNPLRPWKHSLTGTPRYASISNHLGKSQSRRDDLESLAYVLIYFLQGKLPWQGIKADDKHEKYRLILQVKESTPIQKLCKGCPPQFGMFLEYARGLDFMEDPNYDYLHALFTDESAPTQRAFDWEILQNVRGVNTAVAKFGDEQLPPAILAQREALAAQAMPPAPPVAGAGAVAGDTLYQNSGAKRTAAAASGDQPAQWSFESNDIHPQHQLVRSKRGLVHKARCGPTIEKKSIHRSMYKCVSCDVTICLPTCPGRCYQLHVKSELEKHGAR